MSQGASKYKEASILTATPEQLLLMYYEATIRHLRTAIQCIDDKDIAGRGAAIGKAHDILNELANNLNFEVGGKVASDLERLYSFMVEQLLKANSENTKAPLEFVVKMLENLLGAWREAVKKVLKERAGAAKKAPEGNRG